MARNWKRMLAVCLVETSVKLWKWWARLIKYETPIHPNHLFPFTSHALSIMREIIYFIKIAGDFEKWAARWRGRTKQRANERIEGEGEIFIFRNCSDINAKFWGWNLGEILLIFSSSINEKRPERAAGGKISRMQSARHLFTPLLWFEVEWGN